MIDVQNIDFTVLYDSAAELVQMYKQELETQKVNASGSLSNSADFDYDFDEDSIVLYFIYNSYGYYVNEGRKPTGGGGGQVWGYPQNVNDISQWMQNKISRGWWIPRNNKPIPTKPNEIKRVAYAIVRKIHREGYYGTSHQGLHILQTVLDKAQASGLIDKMVDSVVQAFDNDVNVEFEKI